ncbi:MAG: hypothetical protein AB8H80_06820 [Planctomycetota bacterium]
MPSDRPSARPLSASRLAAVACLALAMLGAALSAQTPNRKAGQKVAPHAGEMPFRTFCSACHVVDRPLVGPSLVEIRGLYKDRPDDFIAWCKKPQQKRKGSIQMPSMAFVPDQDLRAIHAYVVSITANKKEANVKGADRFRASPSMRRRPLVQRIFMPDAGPAAIAVAIDDTRHFCWDAGSCRLRYVWSGDFIDGWPVWRANGNALAKVVGDVWLRESKSPLAFANTDKPRFRGYRMKDGLPTFRYQMGKLNVEERITKSAQGLARHFKLENAPESVQLTLTASKRVRYSSEDGTFADAVFTPAADKRTAFTIVMTEAK